MTNNPKTYDLEERTAKFGESIIELVRKMPRDEVTRPLITQLVKSATSVGANYCEADDAESKMDFKHKIGICKKEARETKHFLRMMAKAVPTFKELIINNCDFFRPIRSIRAIRNLYNSISIYIFIYSSICLVV